ncbi:hypothetical protein [Aliisedimentitalea sp. MJ-SS2]|uniref:hypothetical protein n=1 Tax=Aliisedimentitalea sp. MJ-SS2 TaxID=3049795 RepID=UPI00292EF291|nr:hypothetical protein [Alisedimentitalea sp. MJ-SS2]
MLTETRSVVFKGVNYWRSAEKYALAGKSCNTESYLEFGADKMASTADSDPTDEIVSRMVQDAPMAAHDLMMYGVNPRKC